MILLTYKAGWGRNRRIEIQNGRILIHRNGTVPETTLNIKNGLIEEVRTVEFSSGNNSTRTVTANTWNKSERTTAGTVQSVKRYGSFSSLPSEGAFYEVTGLRLGRRKGTLRQISRRSRFIREEFIYDNGQEAYVWTPCRKRFQVFRPSGKLWLEVTAKVSRPYKRTENLMEKVREALKDLTEDGERWSYGSNYEIRLYDRYGKEHGYGKVENNQRTGVWRHGETNHYFMMGVSVSKEIYFAGPDDLDPREVLKTENAQLRAALMKKIGPERLLKKLPFVSCDADGENRLLKADVDKIFNFDNESLEQSTMRNRLDRHIAIAVLKCPSTGQLYYLRVPPRLKKVEHARQWLCCIDIENVEEEYIRERWLRRTNGGNRELSQSEQSVMEAELLRASERERLEFVAEA